MDNNIKIYVVLSRDNSSFIFATPNKEEAEKIMVERIESEEMGGGRPSVYIRETNLVL